MKTNKSCSKCGKEEFIATFPGQPDLCVDCFFGVEEPEKFSPLPSSPLPEEPKKEIAPKEPTDLLSAW